METGMSDQLIFFVSVTSSGLFVALFTLLVSLFNSSVPEENREYMDPLPKGLRLLWPFIRIIAYYFGANLPKRYLELLEKRLNHTGVAYLLTPEQFVALRIMSAVIVTGLTAFMLFLLRSPEVIWVFLAPIGGFFFPDVWLHDTRKRRQGAIVRQLPIYLDFITMSVEAGLNMAGALAQAREKGPAGPMRSELTIVLRDIRSGSSRAEALRRMADRLNITEITSFVSAVIQAERMGSSLGTVLRTQAEQRRSERFQRAEKLAMEAPVKLIGPLILFIFPVTFIVIGFPLYMKFMAEGLF